MKRASRALACFVSMAVILSTFTVPGEIFAATKTKTVTVPVEGQDYTTNISVDIDDTNGRIIRIRDNGSTNSNGTPISGYDKTCWDKAWLNLEHYYDGKNLEDVKSLEFPDSVTGATDSARGIKKSLISALTAFKDSIPDDKDVGNYLQPKNSSASYGKETVIKLDITNKPEGSDYYLAERDSEWITKPGENERKPYYSSEYGVFDVSQGTYTIKKGEPGEQRRVIFKDRAGLYPNIEINVEIVPSITLENGKLISSHVDIKDFVKDIRSAKIISEGRTVNPYGVIPFRVDGYVNTAAKYNNKKLFENGKIYKIELENKNYGKSSYSFNMEADSPQVEVDSSMVSISPSSQQYDSSVKFQLDLSQIEDGKYKVSRVTKADGTEITMSYSSSSPTYASYSDRSKILTINKPSVDQYKVYLSDESGMFADIVKNVEVTEAFTIENNQIISTNPSLSVSDYIGSRNTISIKNLKTGEIKSFNTSADSPVSRNGQINRAFIENGKMLFEQDGEYEITVDNFRYNNPAIKYIPTGIETITNETVVENSVVKYSIRRENDDSKYIGEEVVVQNGVDGKTVVTSSYIAVDGVKVEGTESSTEKVILPIDEIVKVGTKKKEAVAHVAKLNINDIVVPKELQDKMSDLEAYDVYPVIDGEKVVAETPIAVVLESEKDVTDKTKLYHEKQDGTVEEVEFMFEGKRITFQQKDFSHFFIYTPKNVVIKEEPKDTPKDVDKDINNKVDNVKEKELPSNVNVKKVKIDSEMTTAKAVKTGDSTSLSLMAGMLIISIIGLAFVAGSMKKIS